MAEALPVRPPSLAWRRTLAAGWRRLGSGRCPRGGRGKAALGTRSKAREKPRIPPERGYLRPKQARVKGRQRGDGASGGGLGWARRKRTDRQGKGKESTRREGKGREKKGTARARAGKRKGQQESINKTAPASKGNQKRPGKAKGSREKSFEAVFSTVLCASLFLSLDYPFRCLCFATKQGEGRSQFRESKGVYMGFQRRPTSRKGS